MVAVLAVVESDVGRIEPASFQMFCVAEIDDIILGRMEDVSRRCRFPLRTDDVLSDRMVVHGIMNEAGA